MVEHGTDCIFKNLLRLQCLLWLQDEYIEAMLAKVEEIYGTAHRIHDTAIMRVVRGPFHSEPLYHTRDNNRTNDGVMLQIDEISCCKGPTWLQAMVGYRDHCSPADERFEVFPFTGMDGVEKFRDFLRGIRCNGGGDGPEDVAGGLQAPFRCLSPACYVDQECGSHTNSACNLQTCVYRWAAVSMPAISV